MTCRTVSANGTTYRYCPDDPPPVADRVRSLMHAHIIDELTQNSITADTEVSTSLFELHPRSTNTGVVGLAGNPARRFPQLDTAFVELDMTVTTANYIARHLAATLGPINTGSGAPVDFPDHFEPIDLGTIPLHRRALTLRGRTVQTSGSGKIPLNGVTVDFQGIWRRFPAPDEDPLLILEPADILSLHPGLYRQRSVGTDVVHTRTITTGTSKELLTTIEPGSNQVRLSDRVGTNVSDLLVLDAAADDRIEHIRIDAIDGALDPSLPATLSLAYPCQFSHTVGTVAFPATLDPLTTTSNALSRDGIEQDVTLYLNGISPDVAASGLVEMAGAGIPEYHIASRYTAVSDARGYFVLPPLSRVAQLQLQGARLGLTTLQLTLSPDYTPFENTVDLVFGP